ncbi:MAG: sugar transferase [Chloroflexi bacterium]|nr:sugar transferase [Chloroflexota bacterium]
MIRRHATAFRLLLAVIDASTAIAVLALAGLYRFGSLGPFNPLFPGLDSPAGPLAVYAIGWLFALWSQGLYRPRARLRMRSEIVDVLRATLAFTAGVLSLLFLFKLPDVSRAVLLLVFPILAVSAFAERLVLRLILTSLRQRGRNTRFVLVVGVGSRAQAFADLVELHQTLGLRVIGHLDPVSDEEVAVSRPVIGRLADIESVLHANVVDEVAICLPLSQWAKTDEIARLCEEEGKIVRIPMFVLEHTLSTGRVEEFAGIPIYSIVSGPDRVVAMLGKRALDIIGAVAGLIVTAPLALGIAIAIRRDSPGPVLFRQRRVGLHGRTFEVVKFRTMIDGAEERLDELQGRNEIRGHAFKITDDPRITKVGHWLRRTSLDELPQLWNVLAGEMSLVGPRPPLPTEVAGYDIWHRRRLSMKPGITGLWQVRSRSEQDFDRWVEADLEYIDRWTFWLDLRIMLQTIPAVIGRSGR